jgi:hypothetical protein
MLTVTALRLPHRDVTVATRRRQKNPARPLALAVPNLSGDGTLPRPRPRFQVVRNRGRPLPHPRPRFAEIGDQAATVTVVPYEHPKEARVEAQAAPHNFIGQCNRDTGNTLDTWTPVELEDGPRGPAVASH